MNDPVEDIHLQPGGALCEGRYEVVSSIGQGGFGRVYKARDLRLKRDVAVKCVSFLDEETIRKFKREAATLAQVVHPTVVRIYDFLNDEKYGPLIFMEYVIGKELSEVVSSAMPFQEAVDLILSVCSGVYACHRRGIIHRDLKPRNILLTQSSDWMKRTRILDFGLAIPLDSPALRAYQTKITSTGVIAGTPRFMAPELIRREAPTAACDQYSLASILYFTIAGQPAFNEQEDQALLRAILQGDYPSLHRVRTGLPEGLVNAIFRAMHVDPGLRFASVADFSMALLPFASPKGNSRWTQYFSNVLRPVDPKLLEPVSAIVKPEDLGPMVNRILKIEEKRPSPIPSTLKIEKIRTPIPDPKELAPVPVAVRGSYHKHLLGTFALGTIFGAALAVLITMALLNRDRFCTNNSKVTTPSSLPSR